MAHGDSQRLGGELGYGTDKLPLVAEDDVTVEAPAADEIAYDEGANTIVLGETVQEALDAVDLEFGTPTHEHAGGSGPVESILNAAVSTTTTYNPHPTATLFTLPLEAAATYDFELMLHISAAADATAGIFLEFQLTGLTGEYANHILKGSATNANAAGEPAASSANHATRWNEIDPKASAGLAVVGFTGTVTTVDAGDLVIKVGAFQTASSIRKGSRATFRKMS